MGPLISAEDGVGLLLLLGFAMPGIAGMLDQLVQEARMNGVQHIEEPFSGMRLLARAPFILHMELDGGILTHKLTNLRCRKLIEVRHRDVANLRCLEDLLLSSKDLLEEGLVEVGGRR